jgi:hypothetical protein
MRGVTSDEDCDEVPLEGLANLESTSSSRKSKIFYLVFTKLKKQTSHHPWAFPPPLAEMACLSTGMFYEFLPSPWIFITSSTYFSCKEKKIVNQ